jgi:hypothetical protein
MKKRTFLLSLLSFIILLSSCSGQGENQVTHSLKPVMPEESTPSTVEPSETSPASDRTPTVSSPVPSAISIGKPYAGAYYNIVADNQTELLVDELSGNAMTGDNCSDISFVTVDGKRYVAIGNCDWGAIERIKIFTIENGVLKVKKFNADAEMDDVLKGYNNCTIDDKPVTEEEYIAQKAYYLNGDGVLWSGVEENGKYRNYTKDDAIQFIKSLAADAGISEESVNTLLGENNT